jgi:hypothetical protein
VTSCFIYYRVTADQLDRLAAAVGEIQKQVAAATGIRGRLLRKDDASNTWMEIYEGIGDPARFESAMQHAVAQTRFDSLLAAGSQRHVERFVDTAKDLATLPPSCA